MNESENRYPNNIFNVGETGSYLKTFDWKNHPLGQPCDWPQTLHTTLGIILSSKFPMFLFWGADHFCFYNDAYSLSLGSEGKHPGALGRIGKDVWPEIWEHIKPRIEKIRAGGETSWHKDEQFPIYRNDKLEEAYWTYSYSAVTDEKGNIAGVLSTCYETTNAVLAERELINAYKEKNQILESIDDGFFALNKDWTVTYWNKAAERILGKTKKETLGRNLWYAYPEAKKLKFYTEYKKVINEGVTRSFQEYFEQLDKWFEVTAYPAKSGISVFFKDITEKQRFLLINNRTEQISGVAGWEYNVTSGKIFMTPKAYEIYGLPVDREASLNINEALFDRESLNKIEAALAQAIQQKKPYKIEIPLKSEQVDSPIIEAHGFPYVENGKVTKIYGTLEDISKKKKARAELKNANRKLRTAQKIAKLGYWSHDIINSKSEWAEEVYNIWGVKPETFTPDFEKMLKGVHPEDEGIFMVDFDEAFPDQKFIDVEHRIITPEGKIKWVLQKMSLHRDEEGKPSLLEGIAQDITKRKQAEIKLQNTEEKLRDIVEHSTNLFYTHTTDHVITFISKQTEDFFGYSQEEAMRLWTEFGTENPVNKIGLKSTERAIKTGKPQPPYELELKKKNGDIIWVEVNEAPVVKNGKTVAMVGSLTDITYRKKARQEIAESLKEKEILLAEIHHRVKNNLAVVSGLMLLQSSEVDDLGLIHTLHDSINRIKTIANIHEHLYKSDSFSKLDFNENIQTLISALSESMDSGTRITLNYHCDPVLLNINQALPCSLIVNEVVTNIFKHAFIGRDKGTVSVFLKEENQQLRLVIEDNGIALPDNFETNKTSSLGLHLIDLLARQLKAEYDFDSSGAGTRYTLQFKKSDTTGIASAHL